MIYVMSDIHGMYDKYKEMLDLIDLQETDSLYILGDVVDRGPNPIKILQDMMQRPNVVPLIGNHELMMMDCMNLLKQEITEESLDHLKEEELIKLSDWMNNGALQTIQELKTLNKEEQEELFDYVMDFTLYEKIKVNDKTYWLVHASLGDVIKTEDIDKQDIHAFVWRRPDWDIPYFNDKNTFVVVGHTPTLAITGKAEIFYHNTFIAIDCGACFPTGKLACLCLDTMEEFYV